MSPDPCRPWERLPEETPPAFAAFHAYVQQGTARSVTKVAEECSKSRSLMNRWSSRHRWRARSEAWDAYLSSQYRAELVDAQRTLAHRHLGIAHAALDKVGAAVVSLAAENLTVAELVKLWDIATRTEREALQMPLRLEVSGPNSGAVRVAGMTDEERLARLVALRAEVDERIGEGALPDGDPDQEPDNQEDEEDQDDGETPAEHGNDAWWLADQAPEQTEQTEQEPDQ